MTRRRATFVVPGGWEADTGGNIYDRLAALSLERRGWEVSVVGSGDGVDADVVILDSLAFAAGPPATSAPVLALVHQLPSEAAGRKPSAAEADVLRRAATVVPVSHGLGERARGLGARSVVVVPPGRDRAWAREGPRADATTVLCVGNGFPGKGLPEAVDAFTRAAPDRISMRVVGDLDVDPKEGARTRTAAERAERPVEIVGVLSPADLSRAYHESLVLLTASRYEGWPIAVAEAMASGLPVVGFEVPGVAELVRDGTDGILIPGRDVAALSVALGAVCADARLRTRLGNAARERALSWPTWNEAAERFADVVEALAGQPSGAPYAP